MFYAKDGSFLVDAEALGRPDQDTAGPILVQGFLQYLCQGTSAFAVEWRLLCILTAIQVLSSPR